ncbi:hypothetical protein [Moraxella oculi]|uniref:Uncharacterized protein n=1 Tax=Moraxella oculi TaxID=2940516 RepID=A0ABW8U513_9GAMM
MKEKTNDKEMKKISKAILVAVGGALLAKAEAENKNNQKKVII